MTPPAPMQNSFSSSVRNHGRCEEGRGWNARERTIIARIKQYLERSFSVKVRVEELEGLLAPEDVDVDLRRILKEARDERGRNIFETFGSDDMSFLVAEWSRWDKYKRAPWRQDSSVSARDGGKQAWDSLGNREQVTVGWSQDEKRVTDAVEDYLEKCAQVIVKIDLVESLLMPENLEVSSRNVLNHANYGSRQHLPALRHNRKAESLSCKQKTMVGKSGERRCEAGEWEKRVVRPWVSRSQGKSSAVPQQHSTPLLCFSKARRRPREEEDHWELRDERRRRRIAFENLAKSMLRYFDNCNEVKVGITVLQERVEVPEQIGISIQQVARQAMNEDGQTFIFSKLASWSRWEAQRKGLVDLERRCQDISREIQMLNKRQEIFQSAIEGTASERLQDQSMEEVKELESTKTE